MGIPHTLVSWKQMSYLPPTCSLRIAPASIGAMPISFIAKLRLCGETLSNACFTSIEQVITPTSAPHSLAAAAISLMAVEISVALLLSSKPKVWTLPTLVSPAHVPHLHIQQAGETSTTPLCQHTLHTHMPLVCPSSLSITFFFEISTMLFLSHASMSSLFCPLYLILEWFFDFQQSSPCYEFEYLSGNAINSYRFSI